jgi:putative tricarboxylic transport membrane protein
MPLRNPKDFWTGIIYIAFGSGALIIARDYGFGTARKMGPAFFPAILSIILIVIGVISLVRSLIRPGTPIGRFTFKGLLLVTGATLLFGLLVRRAGLIVAMPALVIMSGYANRRFRWGSAVALAIVLTTFCILIFLKGLGIPLPVFGPWFGG